MVKIGLILKKVFDIVRQFGLKRLFWVIVLVVFQGVFQALSVFSLLPFLSSLGDSKGSQIFNKIPIPLPEYFIRDQTLFLGLIALLIILTSNVINLLGDHHRSTYVFDTSRKVGLKIFSNYLFSSYTFHLKNNSSELVKRIQGDVNTFMSSILMALIDTISRVMNTIFIFMVLLIFAPTVSIITLFAFGLSMYLFFVVFKKNIKQGNSERKSIMSIRYLTTNEALFGIKTVQIQQSQNYFIQRVNNLWKKFNEIDVFANIAAMLPRYTIESLAFSSLIGVIIFYRDQPTVLKEIVPVMIMLVVAAYRILPNLQLIYAHVTKMQSNAFVIDIVYQDLIIDVDSREKKRAPVFNSKIVLNELTYCYPGAEKKSLDGVSLIIDKGQRVGIVGSSGAGKSTLIEILTGILNSDSGTYNIDELSVRNLSEFDLKGLFGFVPQDVFLLDDTIINNIAFGVSSEDVDFKRVERACEIAQIKNLIEDLPRQYQTICGESGTRFSGGQKQRIALARALYHEPQILVLDEATSALDNETEKRFIEAIYNLPRSITVIMIAHRLSTVKSCDNIFVMDKGKVVDSGKYDYLQESSKQFQNLSKTT